MKTQYHLNKLPHSSCVHIGPRRATVRNRPQCRALVESVTTRNSWWQCSWNSKANEFCHHHQYLAEAWVTLGDLQLCPTCDGMSTIMPSMFPTYLPGPECDHVEGVKS